jgi:catechol 2,3-dioxygenase-like lactoylglutathione lyase family enzyme
VILDHVVVNVTDLERSRAFYAAALAPLGIAEIMARPGTVGYGRNGKPEFWIRERAGAEPVHVAFAADRPTVDAFHAAALAAGATDNGGPGVRVVYHPGYYGAFVLDPDGHNIEAVCHRPVSGG